MISRQHALTALKQFKTRSGSKYGIVSLGIFGSLARNQANESSDVDIVIETQKADAFQMVHIKEELEALLKTPVDVVRKRNRMNEILQKQIEKDAVYV
jgi:predicted nucleotidyltransferase